MSAPITKQHLKLIDEIRVGDRSMRFDITDAQAAQLIADSEAKATAELRTVFPQICAALGNGAFCTPDVSVEFIKAIPNEVAEVVAQLRAEVERLTAACDKFSNDEITQGDWQTRAERAEAELSAEQDMRSCVEVELHGERAKVRMLRAALQNLADEQNGAPLERRREEWQEAMDEAIAALASTAAF